jgi:SAM-dependent methyltransferase
MSNSLLQNIIQESKFKPTLLGFFINNNFLIRTELFKNINANTNLLTGSLLDFGCATKPYKKYITNVTEYIGVDYKIEGWEHRQNEVDVFYDGNTIPFDNDRFDSMICTEVFEHVFNLETLLSECNRVLKPGAIALITTPFMWEEHEVPYDFARYTPYALKHLYEKHGFEIVSHIKSGNNIKVISQFSINYFKNIFPKNKKIKQVMLIPFIVLYNTLGLVFGNIMPNDKNAYFNNVFILRKTIK